MKIFPDVETALYENNKKYVLLYGYSIYMPLSVISRI